MKKSNLLISKLEVNCALFQKTVTHMVRYDVRCLGSDRPPCLKRTDSRIDSLRLGPHENSRGMMTNRTRSEIPPRRLTNGSLSSSVGSLRLLCCESSWQADAQKKSRFSVGLKRTHVHVHWAVWGETDILVCVTWMDERKVSGSSPGFLPC